MRLLNLNGWALLSCAVGAALCLSCAGAKPKPAELCDCDVIGEAAASAQEYEDKARSYLGEDNLDSAILAASEAIRLVHDGPDAVAAYVIRASAYYEKKEYDQAVQDASEAIGLSPDDWGDSGAGKYLTGAYIIRAIARQDMGDYERAVEDVSKAIQRRPNAAVLYNKRAWLCAHYLKRDFDRAIEDANRAIKIDPGEEAYYDTRGWAYFGLGDYDNAEKDFSKALTLDPDLPESKEGLQKIREAREAEPKTEPDK